MKVFRGFGALLSAGMLLLSAVGLATAAPPTYGISVSKSADPANVPPGGADVTFTTSVTATGDGFFLVVSVADSLAGCALAGPFGDEPSGPSAGRLDGGETWTYMCALADVAPGTVSTATVHACHNTGTGCNQAAHDATGQAQVTLGEGTAPTEVPPTEVPPTEVPPTEVPPTEVPPTEVPPTEVPPTEVPPTEVPPTEVPPTQVPPTEVPPTEAPPTEVPPTEAPPTEVPPTEAPPTEVPPTEVPPTEVPLTEVLPTEVPPTEAPPTEVPPTEVPLTEVSPTQAPPTGGPGSEVPSSDDPSQAPSSEGPAGDPSFEQDVAGVVDGGPVAQPDTDSVVRRVLSSGPNQSVWLIVGVLGLLVGAIVMVSPSRTARRS
jgi:hypothetical protein